MIKLYIYSSITWFFLLILAIINGSIREGFYARKVGEKKAHQVSSTVFIVLIFVATYCLLKFFNLDYSERDLWIVGGMWTLMTMLFEFLFGHYIMKHSWKTLFRDYNIFSGRVWILVLLAEFFAPILIHNTL